MLPIGPAYLKRSDRTTRTTKNITANAEELTAKRIRHVARLIARLTQQRIRMSYASIGYSIESESVTLQALVTQFNGVRSVSITDGAAFTVVLH
jgi:hypothetical protein